MIKTSAMRLTPGDVVIVKRNLYGRVIKVDQNKAHYHDDCSCKRRWIKRSRKQGVAIMDASDLVKGLLNRSRPK